MYTLLISHRLNDSLGTQNCNEKARRVCALAAKDLSKRHARHPLILWPGFQCRLDIREGDELVDRDLRAEQAAEDLAVVPAVDAHDPGDAPEPPAEEPLERELRQPDPASDFTHQGVDEVDQRDEGQQHRADVHGHDLEG